MQGSFLLEHDLETPCLSTISGIVRARINGEKIKVIKQNNRCANIICMCKRVEGPFFQLQAFSSLVSYSSLSSTIEISSPKTLFLNDHFTRKFSWSWHNRTARRELSEKRQPILSTCWPNKTKQKRKKNKYYNCQFTWIFSWLWPTSTGYSSSYETDLQLLMRWLSHSR